MLSYEEMKHCESCDRSLCNPVLSVDYNCYDKNNDTVSCSGAEAMCYT